MQKITLISESDKVLSYLLSRQLEAQYQKAKRMLLSGFPQKFDFKIREPKDAEIYQFRINQKYRAFGYME